MLHKQVRAQDGGVIMIGHLKAVTANGNAIVIRTNNSGTIRWSKKMTSNPFSGNIAIETIEEANNGNIHILARYNNGVYDGSPPFHLLVLSPAGDMINQKRFGFSNSPGLNNKVIRTSLILKKGNDSLLYILSGQINAFTENQLFLVTADQSGNMSSSVILNALPSGGWNFPVFRKGSLNGDQLTLYGSSDFIGQCVNGSSNGLAFFMIKIDISSRSVIVKKAYCAPANAAPGIPYQAPRDFFSTEAYDNTFLLTNGNIIMTKAYNGIESGPAGSTNRLFSISEFDAAFNHLHSEYLVTGNSMRDKTIQELFIDSMGTRHFSCYDYETKNVYYALADATNALFLQKKIPLPSSKQYTDFTRNSMADSKYLVNFSVLSYDNNATHLDKFKILASDTAELCFGTDTSMLNFIPAQVSPINWQAQFSGGAGVLEEMPINFFMASYPLQRSVVCNIVSRCDSIKLTTPGTVCDISNPVMITAHKNSLCKGKVLFTFDTSQVLAYRQVNDTTLSLTFNKSCRLKIMAQPSACDQLKDSAELIVSIPASPVDLGEDIINCPGRTYLLNAANPAFRSYQWQDGSTDSIYLATNSGTYFVTATDYCNRIYSDTIIIAAQNFNLNLGKDSTICRYGEMILNAPAGYLNYTWEPASLITAINPWKVLVNPETNTTFTLQAEIFAGCFLRDTINISVKNCPEYIRFPNSFTPNGDGNNDSFRPLLGGALENYELVIYNRTGQIVFRTTSRAEGWSGRFRGTVQDMAVYVWICRYKFYNKQENFLKGTVTLVR